MFKGTTSTLHVTPLCSGGLATTMTHNCFHLCGVNSSIGSESCGTATITDPEGHILGCCHPHYCATAAT